MNKFIVFVWRLTYVISLDIFIYANASVGSDFSIVPKVLGRKNASPMCALVSIRECNSVHMCPGLIVWSSVVCSFIFTGERNITYVLDWKLIVSLRESKTKVESGPSWVLTVHPFVHILTALYNLMLPGLFEVFLLQVPCSSWWKIHIQLLQIPNSSKDFSTQEVAVVPMCACLGVLSM